MEIDKNNFDSFLCELKLQIDECDFLSIDTELTGLHSQKTNFYDTAEVRYKHLKDHSMEYAVTQFGICLFKYNASNNCVDYAPVNFHLLACEKSERENFTVNINTLHFLNKTNFDYNKSWREGISFIRYSEYNQLLQRNNAKMDHELSVLKEEMALELDFSSLELLIEDCNIFMHNDDVHEMSQSIKFTPYEYYLAKECLSNKIGCVNGKWLFTTIEYDSVINQRVIKCIKCEDYNECKRNHILEYYTNQEETLRKRLRFSEIIKHISDSKKNIIGHNCLLDCLHMFDKFIGPLPDTYAEFKTVFNSYFPNCFDTKYMIYESKHDIFKDLTYNNLQGVYEASLTLPNNPKYSPVKEEYRFAEGNNFHTAHYDAMVTGILFLNLLVEIGPIKNFESDASGVLPRFKNKFNLVNAEVSFINVDPLIKDRFVGRGKMFYLTIPYFWQRMDVFKYLSEIIKKSLKEVCDTVRVNWINDTSVMVKCPDTVNVSNIPLGVSGEVTIVKYDHFYNSGKTKTIMEEGGFTVVKSKKRKQE